MKSWLNKRIEHICIYRNYSEHMEQVTFYDSNRNPKMTWYNACNAIDGQKHLIQFEVLITTSFFNVFALCAMEKSRIIQFMERLVDLYEERCHEVTLDSGNECLYILMHRSPSGKIKYSVSVRKAHNSFMEFVLRSDFDQTFLPELQNDIRVMLQSSLVVVNHFGERSERDFSFDVFLLEQPVFDDYICFRIKIKDSYFHVVEETMMSLEEYQSLKEELLLLMEGKKEEVLFSPLGEFWSVSFIHSGEAILVQGYIIDKEMPQSSLTFHRVVPREWCSNLYAQLVGWAE